MAGVIPVTIRERRADEKGVLSVRDQHLGVQELRKAADATDARAMRVCACTGKMRTKRLRRIDQEAGIQENAKLHATSRRLEELVGERDVVRAARMLVDGHPVRHAVRVE